MNRDTLAGAIEAACNRWRERPVLVFRGQTTTFTDFGRSVATLARAYQKLNIGRGDRVVCQLPNSPAHMVAAAAAWTRGAVHVGADHELTGPELCAYIRLTGAKTLIYAPIAGSSDPLLPLLVVQERHPDVHLIVAGNTVPPGTLALSELINTASTPPCDDLSLSAGPMPDDPAAIFTTSGTTGKPKTPLGYHGKLHRSWNRLAEELQFDEEDVHLAHLPLSHGFGLMLAIAGLISGGRLVLLERFSTKAARELIESERITVLNGTPAHFRLLLDSRTRMQYDFSSLRIGVASGAAFSPALLREIFDKLQMELMLMYGSSEGVGVGTTDREDMLQGSVGRPISGSVAIFDLNHQPLSIGEVGEIAFSREVFPVRYWPGPHDKLLGGTIEEQASGWYYTGDLGRLDAEGRLYVMGRIKNQINRGGLKIDPVEVESTLLQCDNVADAAVVGIPNPILGEVICACIVPDPGYPPSLEDVRTTLSHFLAPYKLPDELFILDRIPRTGLGKIDFELLREKVAANSVRQRGESKAHH